MKHFDLIILGSGGGLKLVDPALKKGMKVALIEKDRLGGTCLNRGCIPSKMIIHPADVACEIREAKKFDIGVNTNFSVDFKKLVSRISKTVFSDSNKIKEGIKRAKNLTLYSGECTFVKDKVLSIKGEEITAPIIVIATGAKPRVPNIPGLEGTPYMTSTEALRNTKQPKSLIVVGGGYIAVELGHAYGALGTKVHFLVRGRMVGKEDSEIIGAFEKAFAKKYHVHFDTSTDAVSYKNGIFSVQCTQGKKKITLKGDALLIATSVMPCTDTLVLKNTNIAVRDGGFIKVNEFMQTTVSGVYAMGDCVGNYMFRHSVNFEADYLINQLFNKGKKSPIRYPPMPHAIFTNPQIAGVGATEDELKSKKTLYVVGKCKYIDTAMGRAMLEEDGFVKLLFDKKTKKLLGGHIIGPDASIMIHQIIAHMTKGDTIDDMLSIIYIHPAMPEAVRNACRNALKEF